MTFRTVTAALRCYTGFREQVKSNVTGRRNHSAMIYYSSREYITVEKFRVRYSVILIDSCKFRTTISTDKIYSKLYLRTKVLDRILLAE